MDLKGAKSSIDTLKAEIVNLKEQLAASAASLNAEKEASFKKIAVAESAKSSAEMEQKAWYLHFMQ